MDDEWDDYERRAAICEIEVIEVVEVEVEVDINAIEVVDVPDNEITEEEVENAAIEDDDEDDDVKYDVIVALDVNDDADDADIIVRYPDLDTGTDPDEVVVDTVSLDDIVEVVADENVKLLGVIDAAAEPDEVDEDLTVALGHEGLEHHEYLSLDILQHADITWLDDVNTHAETIRSTVSHLMIHFQQASK